MWTLTEDDFFIFFYLNMHHLINDRHKAKFSTRGAVVPNPSLHLAEHFFSLHDTFLQRNPKHPVKDDNLSQIIQECTAVSTACMKCADVARSTLASQPETPMTALLLCGKRGIH